MSRVRAFVVVAPGLEELAAGELRSVAPGVRGTVSRGGVELDLTTRQLYSAHRWCRVPTRVLVRVAGARITRFDDLEQLIASVDWGAYLGPEATISVHAASSGSRLYHEGAIVERATRVLDRPVDRDGQRIHVRIDHDRATISVDATGDALHRRGWRTAAHAAPLRPTLAAAMLRAAGYTGAEPLIDPMTGSGTIAIEAAAIARHLPIEREFAFRRWPSFEPGTWASATAATWHGEPAPILAADRDAGAAAMASEHAATAGVGAWVHVEAAALTAQTWPVGPGLVACNPPYGRRLGDRDALRDLYAALGARVREGGHRLCMLAADEQLARSTGLPLRERFATANGGIAVRCWVSEPPGMGTVPT